MRILIVSDAWTPQVNGVVTSLQALISELRSLGHQVKLLSPADFRAVPCPSYPEIPLVWNLWRVGPAIRAFRPDCVHLATEGPLGIAARSARLAQSLTGARLAAHQQATRRLTDPAEMGSLFKALAIFPAQAAAPPGFDL